MLVDLVGAFEDRAMAAGKLDERSQVRRLTGDAARRNHRQQPVLFAADHQRRHGEVLQPDVPGPESIDQRAGPAATTRGRRRGEQLVDELGDRRIGVAAHREHGHEPAARPVHRTQQRRRAERLEQGAGGKHPGVGQRRRHRHELHIAQQVTGRGVDQRDGVSASPNPPGYRWAHDVIAMPPIECPAMTARSPGSSVAPSTASRSAARKSRL